MNVPSLQAPVASTTSATGNPRNKTALKPGHSLMDWIRLGTSGRDLTGVGGQPIDVSETELAKHNTVADAWIVIRGRVYNVSAYMDFHPGGVEELLRGVGRDSTQLFDEVHKWVNYQSMLNKCYVGKFIPSAQPALTKSISLLRANDTSTLSIGLEISSTEKTKSLSANNDGFAVPSLPVPVKTDGFVVPSVPVAAKKDGFVIPSTPGESAQKPRYEWYQSEQHVTVVLFMHCKHVRREHVVISYEQCHLVVKVRLKQPQQYVVNVELEHEIDKNYRVKVNENSGKVEVVLTKAENMWSRLGAQVTDTVEDVDPASEFHSCEVSNIEAVNYDTWLYKLCLPDGYSMKVPLGWHVYIRANIQGMEVVRAYTVVPESLQKSPYNCDKTLHLMIKVYPDGALTNTAIAPLQTGDKVDASTLCDGSFDVRCLDSVSHLVLVAAGTGFTPMVGLLLHTLQLSPDRHIVLLFFNKTKKDILWKEDLDKLHDAHANFSVIYILSNPDDGWNGHTGRIRLELLQQLIPVAAERSFLCACGPTAFTNKAIRMAQTDFSYKEDMLHAFLA